jgi:hypothetical protein
MFETGLFQLYVHFCCQAREEAEREEKNGKKGRWTATFCVTVRKKKASGNKGN